MIQTEGIIYLAENRDKNAFGAKTQTEWVSVEDIYLGGGLTYENQGNNSVLVIPFIGDIELGRNNKQILIEENQAVFFENSVENSHKITNPYPDDTINFYEVLFEKNIFNSEIKIKNTDIQNQPNQLLEIFDNIKIGQYELRKEGIYEIQNPENKLFIYTISGAFEAQNRLLQPHDALILWNLKEFEFEALSNDAVILIIEV